MLKFSSPIDKSRYAPWGCNRYHFMVLTSFLAKRCGRAGFSEKGVVFSKGCGLTWLGMSTLTRLGISKAEK